MYRFVSWAERIVTPLEIPVHSSLGWMQCKNTAFIIGLCGVCCLVFYKANCQYRLRVTGAWEATRPQQEAEDLCGNRVPAGDYWTGSCVQLVVFGAICCAEAGAERYWWKFLHHIRRCFFALEPRLLPRASARITGKEPPLWTLRSVFVCVYERAGCGVSGFSGAQSPPILSPCLSSFNTSTALIHTPQQVIIWGVRPCLKTQSKHCSQSQNLWFYVWILSLTNQKYYKMTLSSLIMTI